MNVDAELDEALSETRIPPHRLASRVQDREGQDVGEGEGGRQRAWGPALARLCLCLLPAGVRGRKSYCGVEGRLSVDVRHVNPGPMFHETVHEIQTLLLRNPIDSETQDFGA